MMTNLLALIRHYLAAKHKADSKIQEPMLWMTKGKTTSMIGEIRLPERPRRLSPVWIERYLAAKQRHDPLIDEQTATENSAPVNPNVSTSVQPKKDGT